MQTAEPKTSQDESLLIRTGDGYGLTIAPSAEKQKAELLKHSALIVTIADPVADSAAEIQLSQLAGIRIALEKARVKAKQPALDFGKTVDDSAKAFIKELAEQEARIKKLREGYALEVLQERNRLLKELEEKRAAEQAARDKAAAEEAAALAAKEKAEADAKAAAEAAKAAAEEAERLEWEGADAAKVEAAKVEAVTTAETAKAAEAVIEVASETVTQKTQAVEESFSWGGGGSSFLPSKPKGAKMVPTYEVEDLHKLYVVAPQFVTLEVKHADLLAFIKSQTVDDVPPVISGLKITMTAKVGR